MTSHEKLGETGKLTGSYIPEVAHPYIKCTKAHHIRLPSRRQSPLDADVISFLADKDAQAKMTSSIKLADVVVADYAAIMYPGGHGPMWDLAVDTTSHKIIRDAYESGKHVAFVCHGPAALVNVKLTDGTFLVAGKKVFLVAGFTNEEEDAAGLTKVVPFLLEDAFIKNGANYEKPFVVADGLVITGQNPSSGGLVGDKLVELLA
jgi:putative intracellular protease/amidase